MNIILNYLTVRNLTILYCIVFVAVGLQKYALGHYNNYMMFTLPSDWLLKGIPLYEWRVFQPGEPPELFKYSPAFAFLMLPFAPLSVGLGVALWNLLNATVLVYGILSFLKNDPEHRRRNVLLIVFLEGLIAAQNMQSNNLILGFMLLGLTRLRDEKVFWAAFFFSIVAYFKVYGAAAAIFFLFYPRKLSFLASMAFWMVVLALLPLLVTSPAQLLSEYQQWLTVASSSKVGSQVSVMGILKSWFGLDVNFTLVEAVGLLLFLLPFLQFNKWQSLDFQRLMIAYFLVFVIIFNPMAESPTYVYAITGVALWFTWQAPPTRLDWVLLALVIVFCSLSPSDLFPPSLRHGFFEPYSIKAFPCFLVWCWLQGLVWKKPQREVPVALR
ncbi:MAG: glycosyltransferase family 87 protein [Spirosomataceae bacterium]